VPTERNAIGIVVPHTHWDREWRYPIWRTRVLLVEFMDQLLDVLDGDPEYRCFVMDGQSIVAEDYLEVRPENETRLRRHIESGRIALGPWYTLPDLYPVDGECLIRNLLKGIRYAESLGRCMRVGYNSFGWGQTAQFPQIYAGFGISFAIAAKRVSTERAPECEFLWEAPDGTRILTSRLGDAARANFFFNAYIPIRFGVDYMSAEYRYDPALPGRAAYHEADPENCHKDHFLIESAGGYHADRVESSVRKAWSGMAETTVPDCRLLMDGSDFTTPQPILSRIIRDANQTLDDIRLVHGTLEEYAEELERRVDRDRLRVVRGEMRDGPACDCSANALAVRAPIKQLNKRAQNALIRRAEPLAAVLDWIGRTENPNKNDAKWPESFFNIAWTHMLQSHPHDSINGVTQDKTADDTMNRLRQAVEIAEVVHEKTVASLIRRIDFSRWSGEDVLLLVVNSRPQPVAEPIAACVDVPRERGIWSFITRDLDGKERAVQHRSRKETTVPVHDLETRPWPYEIDRHVVWIDPGEIPAGGYKVLRLEPAERFDRRGEWWPLMRRSEGCDIAVANHVLQNERVRVEVEPAGTLAVTDRATGRTERGLLEFEDAGDVGDYWAYYPPYENRIQTSRGQPARVWLVENGPLAATLAIQLRMEVPARASRPVAGVRGESGRSAETVPLEIASFITLRRGARRVDIRTEVRNRSEDHRLRVLFPLSIRADHSHASGHFTVDERPVVPPRDESGRFYPEMQTLPTQDFVDISDGRYGVALVHNGFTEYEATRSEEGTRLALTLFRSVRNIICTEHRSSGVFPQQKGGQLLEDLTFDYAIVLHEGDWSHGRIYRAAAALNVPPAVFQVAASHSASLPPMASLFSVEPENLILSAFKKAHDRDTFIVRVFNPTPETIEGRVRFPAAPRRAWLTNLNEEREKELTVEGATRDLSLEVAPGKIVTAEVEP